MIPTLVTPPASMPITLAEAKIHCRVDGNEEDALITGLIVGAAGHLDGWTGVLGRCIMPQTWSVDYTSWGLLRLPFPDVSGVSVRYSADDGQTWQAFTDFATGNGALGPWVMAEGPSEAKLIRVEFTAGMNEQLLATAQVVVKLLVGNWYENREAAAQGLSELPMAADMLINAMRWRRL